MKLMGVFLYKDRYLNEILEALAELGIFDVLIIDASSIKKALAYRNPLFAGLRFDSMAGEFSKLILAITPDETVHMLVEILKSYDIDVGSGKVLRIFTLDLNIVV